MNAPQLVQPPGRARPMNALQLVRPLDRARMVNNPATVSGRAGGRSGRWDTHGFADERMQLNRHSSTVRVTSPAQAYAPGLEGMIMSDRACVRGPHPSAAAATAAPSHASMRGPHSRWTSSGTAR
jgi:hypothetical protein